MYVCMYVCIQYNLNTYIHKHAHAYAQNDTAIYKHTCDMYVCMYVCIQPQYIHTQAHMHMHQKIQSYTHMSYRMSAPRIEHINMYRCSVLKTIQLQLTNILTYIHTYTYRTGCRHLGLSTSICTAVLCSKQYNFNSQIYLHTYIHTHIVPDVGT